MVETTACLVLSIDEVKVILDRILPTISGIVRHETSDAAKDLQSNVFSPTLRYWFRRVYLSMLGYAINDYKKKPDFSDVHTRWLLARTLCLFLPLAAVRQEIDAYRKVYECDCDVCVAKKKSAYDLLTRVGLTHGVLKRASESVDSLVGGLVGDINVINQILDVHVVDRTTQTNCHWVSSPSKDGAEVTYHLVGRWDSDGCDGYGQSASWWPVGMCDWVAPEVPSCHPRWQLYNERPPREQMCSDCLKATIICYRVIGPPSQYGYFTIVL